MFPGRTGLMMATPVVALLETAEDEVAMGGRPEPDDLLWKGI